MTVTDSTQVGDGDGHMNTMYRERRQCSEAKDGGRGGMTRAFNGVLAKEKSLDARRFTLWRYEAPRCLLQWANGRGF